MNRPLLTIALAASLWPLSAAAQQAFTMASVDVYAGPSSEYPRVASLPANTPVHVDGCLADWSWCDIDFSGDRGWVYAGDLGYPYENRRVVILDDGAHLGLPVLSFSLNSYWDAHYRNRPWFAQRDDWQRRVSVQGDHRGGQAPAGRAAGATMQQGNVEQQRNVGQQGNVGQRGIGERGNVEQSQPRTSQPPTEPESRMQPQPQPQPQAEPQRRPRSQPQFEEQTTRQQEAQPGKSRPEGESRATPEPDRTQSPDASARRSRGEESREGGAESATSTTLPSNSSADRARSGDQGARQPDRNDRSDGG
jgi:uncharacterized protein YraI